MPLYNTAKLPFDQITLIFQNLLKFVEYDNDGFFLLFRDSGGRLQDVFQRGIHLYILVESEADFRFAFLINGQRWHEAAKQCPARVQQFLGRSAHGKSNSPGEDIDEAGFVIRRPKIDVCRQSVLPRQPGNNALDQGCFSKTAFGKDKELYVTANCSYKIGPFRVAVTKCVPGNDASRS